MNHAILILAHDDPAGLLRLLSRLKHERVRVFIHLDRKTIHRFNLPVLEHRGATVISTRKVNWGGFSICLAEIDLIRRARDEGAFLTYSLISGRDYPVKRIKEIVHELDRLDANLIDNWHNEDPSWHLRYGRMFFYDCTGARLLNAVSRRVARFLPQRKAPQGIKVHFGWQWWTLKYDGVEAIFRFCNERPDVLRWYRFVHIADESFFQTALRNVSNPPKLSRQVRRYIQFRNGSAHPMIIDHDDLDEALAGQYWFARKVDEKECPGVLDAIDTNLEITTEKSER